MLFHLAKKKIPSFNQFDKKNILPEFSAQSLLFLRKFTVFFLLFRIFFLQYQNTMAQ